jgi:putative ABC transport system permease protein
VREKRIRARRRGRSLALGLRLLRREWRSGELRVLAVALLVAVGAVTAVGAFTDRIERGMERGASQLLGADLIVLASDPIPEPLARAAAQGGLDAARTVTFRSVVVAGERFQLAAVKAVDGRYPLEGSLRIADAPFAAGRDTREVPAPGTVWIEARLAGILGIGVGERLELGRARPLVAQILTYEPDRGGDLFNIAPRVLMSLADLPATGLLVAGSRARYRLLLSGPEGALRAARPALEALLPRGARLQGVREARPELRAALERAGQFLGLAALVSVLLAGAAIGVAARRYVSRHVDTAAVMKCLGATGRDVLAVHATQLLVLGLAASLAGCAVGYAAQTGLAQVAGTLILTELPPASGWPVLGGLGIGLVVVAGFALPPLWALTKVAPARVLRRDLEPPRVTTVLAYLASAAAFVALIAWHIREPELLRWTLTGTVAAVAALGGAAWLLVRCLDRLRGSVGVSWRFGLANISRRRGASALQVVAFGLGLTMMLLLTFVRADLLDDWRASLPPGTPNYFLVNVQPDEVQALGAFLAREGLEASALYPMVRGRLSAIDARPVAPGDYEDPRAERLATREFNLSWAERLPPDNAVVGGRWWGAAEAGQPLLSVEEGIARTLGFGLGSELTFSVAGREVSARVHSLRRVQWDSFNVNFFVVFPPGVIDAMPATWITSFHLPGDAGQILTSLVRAFPSVTVIDVDALLGKVREIMEQASTGIELVFLFTLAAGLVVLHAAVQSTLDERRRETALIRTLGADRGRIVRGLVAEFTVLGLLCGVVAALAASAIGAVLAEQVFGLAYSLDPGLWGAGIAAGTLIIGTAGYLGTRQVLDQPPATTLREG